jgi:hypothetical protein
MFCDSNPCGYRASARRRVLERQSALHRLDPRRPHPVLFRSMALPYQLLHREKPK